MTNIQAIDLLKGLEQSLDDYCELNDEGKTAFRMAITALEVFGNSEQLLPAQPEKRTNKRTETHACDCISRQAAIDGLGNLRMIDTYDEDGDCFLKVRAFDVHEMLNALPSAQRTCVNCGRTVNNGGWYADGRTRCPIEERYALPKDGYCHLWEKRNVTDDDYPERREE